MRVIEQPAEQRHEGGPETSPHDHRERLEIAEVARIKESDDGFLQPSNRLNADRMPAKPPQRVNRILMDQQRSQTNTEAGHSRPDQLQSNQKEGECATEHQDVFPVEPRGLQIGELSVIRCLTAALCREVISCLPT